MSSVLKWLASPVLNYYKAGELVLKQRELAKEMREAQDTAVREQKAAEMRQLKREIDEHLQLMTGYSNPPLRPKND